MFLDKGEIVSTRSRNPEDTVKYTAKAGDIAEGLPIVQDHKRAIILGEKSFGKGSVQTVIPLGDHGAMRLTTARYYTPSGRSIQAKGIEPDVEVHPAKVEVIENVFERSEAEFGNALKNDTATGKEKESESKSGTDKELANDYQLSRAVDLVRALGIYGNRDK